eukprot:TRINITY_DN7230_c0_g1_i1.p1 TRINITY_DN7230_c0_g1~~TRINITY_DN7230_c0_g1_i1.p1  ORF type:complete len:602 (+),score=143.82 TRINITY_DN7230_c0_g1_i1:281-2086(+)
MSSVNQVGNDNITQWGSWEDLVLGSAVNRHGTHNWEKVSMELKSRKLSAYPFTPEDCKMKYDALKTRFRNLCDEPCRSGLWLEEELRRLRVAQLKRELELYDSSILSLELKLSKLKAEREESLAKTETAGVPEDPNLQNSETVARDQVPTNYGNVKDFTNVSPVASYNGSSETIAKGYPQEDKMVSDSGLGNQDTRSCAEDTNNDMSPISSRSRKRESKIPAKMLPLLECLKAITSHKFGYMFRHRMETQDNLYYQSIIRRHMDLGLIKSRLEEGSYSGSMEFFRDLLLLFNNALVYYSRGSQEYMAASQLRRLAISEMAHILQTEALLNQAGPSTRKRDSRKAKPNPHLMGRPLTTTWTFRDGEQTQDMKNTAVDDSKISENIGTKDTSQKQEESCRDSEQFGLACCKLGKPRIKSALKEASANGDGENIPPLIPLQQSKKRSRDSDTLGLALSSFAYKKTKTKICRKFSIPKGFDIQNSSDSVTDKATDDLMGKLTLKSATKQSNLIASKIKTSRSSRENSKRNEKLEKGSTKHERSTDDGKREKSVVISDSSGASLIPESPSQQKRVGRPPKHARQLQQDQRQVESETFTKGRKRVRK